MPPIQIYIVTYRLRDTVLTARIRANGKRKARTLALQKFGSGIRILSILPWTTFQKRVLTAPGTFA